MGVWRVPVTVTDARAGACINVWHVRTVANDPIDAQAQINAATAALRTFYNSGAGSYPSGDKITCDFAIEETTSKDLPVTWSPITGSATGNMAPPHLAVCVNLKTGLRGRRARGRIFLGPRMTIDIDSDGTIGGPHLAALNTAMQTLVDASKAANGWALGVWGLENPAPPGYWAGGGTGKELPHVLRDVTGFQINDRFAVMRSRKPKA